MSHAILYLDKLLPTLIRFILYLFLQYLTYLRINHPASNLDTNIIIDSPNISDPENDSDAKLQILYVKMY